MQENTRTLGWKNFQAVFVDSGQSESVTAERCIYGTMSIDEIFPKATMSAVCAPQGLEKKSARKIHPRGCLGVLSGARYDEIYTLYFFPTDNIFIPLIIPRE